MYKCQDITTTLLSVNEIPGLSGTALSTFKMTHFSTAFKCRFVDCYESF